MDGKTGWLIHTAGRLNVSGMRTALSAGATVHEVEGTGRFLAELVVSGPPPKPTLTEEHADECRLAALRLIREHDGLDADAATAALAIAVREARGPAIVEYLLKCGGDVTVRQGGQTLLHRVRRADVASLLIAAGLSAHERSTAGEHPLPVLVQRRHMPRELAAIVKVLLAAGPDPTGRTPYAHAAALMSAQMQTRGAWRLSELRERHGVVAALLKAAVWERRRHLLVAVVRRPELQQALQAAGAATAKAGVAGAVGGDGTSATEAE